MSALGRVKVTEGLDLMSWSQQVAVSTGSELASPCGLDLGIGLTGK